jgi:hypothetical protein
LFEAFAEGLIDDRLQTGLTALAEALEKRGDIVLEGQRSAHTSKHKIFDVLMSNRTAMV